MHSATFPEIFSFLDFFFPFQTLILFAYKVSKRLAQGYEGVNSLDQACKQHDIAYSKFKNTKERNLHDDNLAQEASRIALDANEPDYVRKDARLVTGIMGMKSRFGMGVTTKGGRVALKMAEDFQPQATATPPKTAVKKKKAPKPLQ